MEYKKLSFFSKAISGYAFDSELFNEVNGRPLIRIRDLKKGYSETFTTENCREEYIVKKGDILIGMDGEFNVAKWQSEDALLNQRVCKLIINDNCDKDFIYYSLPHKLKEIENSTSFATVKHISLKQILNIDIPDYDFAKQNKIAKELNILSNLIKIKKNQIYELNQLIKSQFIEMFGEPFDSNVWDYKKLGEITEKISDGNNVDTDNYLDNGDVLYLRIQNVWRNEFRLDDSVYISGEVNKKYIDSSLKYGDILISKIGRYYTKDSSLGRVTIYLGEDYKANYSNNIMAIRLKKEFNSKFINILLNMDSYQKYIRRESKGGTDKRALSKKIIAEFPIITPPLDLQNKYIDIVEQIDKQKFEFEKSLKKLEELQASLMQEYFG